jgi:hypothetical protein
MVRHSLSEIKTDDFGFLEGLESGHELNGSKPKQKKERRMENGHRMETLGLRRSKDGMATAKGFWRPRRRLAGKN